MFAEEAPTVSSSEEGAPPWEILVVDDDEEVRRVTRLVLEGTAFEGRALRCIEAGTGERAIEQLREHADVAVVLLDVVMETESAGLDIIRTIREEMKNTAVRLILRTGQPGQAPERQVVLDYDINDYKEKTELTAQKLFTAVVAALRAYRDIQTIESGRKGLEQVIVSTQRLFGITSREDFNRIALREAARLLRLEGGEKPIEAYVLDARGDLHALSEDGFAAGDGQLPSPEAERSLGEAARTKELVMFETGFAVNAELGAGSWGAVCVVAGRRLTWRDHYLMTIFAQAVDFASANIALNEEMEKTLREIVFSLAAVTEMRSLETAQHVRRVAAYTQRLAELAGLPPEEVAIVHLASALHDLGKIGIPDSILNKPGRLTDEEYETMKSHTQIGYDLLRYSERPMVKAAATIALGHHERFDGAGYPRGLRGSEIHAYGRLTAVADVFDALGSQRSYKLAWDDADIVEHFRAASGHSLDPVLVDLFLQHLDEFVALRAAYPDPPAFSRSTEKG